ncbi:MAG: sigma factor-like helix-turn-helix DNA-binding protein [Nanoarchaeota archaeon]
MNEQSLQQSATQTVSVQDFVHATKIRVADFILCENCKDCIVRQIILDVNAVPEEVCEHCLNMICLKQESVVGHTQSDIARMYNLCRERIRQIQVHAINRLRHHTRRNKLLPLYKFFKDVDSADRLKD